MAERWAGRPSVRGLSYVPVGGSLSNRVHAEVTERTAEYDLKTVTVRKVTPTGSRLKLDRDTNCCHCGMPMQAGDSFRMRRNFGAARPAHVQCGGI